MESKLLLHLLQLAQELLLGLGHLGLSGLAANLLGGPPLLGNVLGGWLLDSRVSSDGSMSLLVHLLHVTGGDTVLDEPAEVLLVSLLVLLLEAGHVVGHVETEDVLSVNISVEFLALRVIAREALLRVRNIQTTINNSLQSGKHLGKISYNPALECYNYNKTNVDRNV